MNKISIIWAVKKLVLSMRGFTYLYSALNGTFKVTCERRASQRKKRGKGTELANHHEASIKIKLLCFKINQLEGIRNSTSRQLIHNLYQIHLNFDQAHSPAAGASADAG